MTLEELKQGMREAIGTGDATRAELLAALDEVSGGQINFQDRYTLATLDALLILDKSKGWTGVIVAKIIAQKYGFAFSTARNIVYNGADITTGLNLRADAQKMLDAMDADAIANARAALRRIADR